MNREILNDSKPGTYKEVTKLTNICKILSRFVACFVVIMKLEEPASLIWSCISRAKKDLLFQVGPTPVSPSLTTVQSVFHRVMIEIQTWYASRRKNGPTSCSSMSFAMKMAYWTFDRRLKTLVVGVFQDAWSTVLSLRGIKFLKWVIIAATTLVALTLVDFSWSMLSGERSKFLRRPPLLLRP